MSLFLQDCFLGTIDRDALVAALWVASLAYLIGHLAIPVKTERR